MTVDPAAVHTPPPPGGLPFFFPDYFFDKP